MIFSSPHWHLLPSLSASGLYLTAPTNANTTAQQGQGDAGERKETNGDGPPQESHLAPSVVDLTLACG